MASRGLITFGVLRMGASKYAVRSTHPGLQIAPHPLCYPVSLSPLVMLQRLPTCRLHPALMVGCVLLAATAYVVPAFGQFSEVWSAKELQIGQNTNLFAHWDGRSSLNGVFVELPSGWTLEEAVALRQGYARVELEVQRMDRGAYVVSAPL